MMNNADDFQTPMSLMRLAMQERAREKLDGYTIHVSNAFPFFDIREFHEPLFLGGLSWNCTTLKEKWIDAHHARDIGAGVWVTPSEVARYYLSIKFPQRKAKCTGEQYDACVLDERLPPQYAQPGAIPNGCYYFDLDGAYWQIVRAVGWNVDYLPGEWLMSGDSCTDFPFRHEKLARNCLVSVGLSRELQLWTGYQMKFLKSRNPFINKILWRAVCDVLNGIAFDVIQAGAKYVNTDGYICSGKDSLAVVEALESWGVRFSIRYHGDYGYVRGIGSYMVGNYQSIPYRKSQRISAMQKVYDPGVDWLRWRFRSFAEQADKDWLFFKGLEGYDD